MFWLILILVVYFGIQALRNKNEKVFLTYLASIFVIGTALLSYNIFVLFSTSWRW